MTHFSQGRGAPSVTAKTSAAIIDNKDAAAAARLLCARHRRQRPALPPLCPAPARLGHRLRDQLQPAVVEVVFFVIPDKEEEEDTDEPGPALPAAGWCIRIRNIPKSDRKIPG